MTILSSRESLEMLVNDEFFAERCQCGHHKLKNHKGDTILEEWFYKNDMSECRLEKRKTDKVWQLFLSRNGKHECVEHYSHKYEAVSAIASWLHTAY